jgi:RNA polymerase sigma-70 factor (ECF subfamily)
MTLPQVVEREADAAESEPRARLIELMEAYERPLFRFLFILAGDREVALDCAQETFVRAYENLRKGKPVNAQWLYRVARNLSTDEFRRRRRHVEETALDGARVEGVEPELGLAMRQAFAHLSPDDRTVLYLVAVEGRSAAEIGAVLGINPTAVRMRVSRARERFRLAYGAAP